MTAARRASPRADEAASRAAVRAFQSDTAEIIAAPVPLFARLTLYLIATMLVTGIVLASVVPVDRVVRARGRIVSEAPTILVQPLDLSILRRIAVREGEVVRKGELLAALDPTFSGADYARLSGDVASLEAEVARLAAELAGLPYAPPAGNAWGAVQGALHAARTAEYVAAVERYTEKIASTEQAIARAGEDARFYRERLGLFSEVEGMRATLAEKKVGSRLSELVATDNRLEMERNVAASEGAMRTSTHELEALRAEKIVYEKGRAAAVAREFAEKRIALDRAREEVAKAERRKDLVELRAVEDAVVLQVGAFSTGSVLQPGEKLMTLVPVDTVLEIDAEIAARDQGSVKPGDVVEVKLDAWPFARHGAAKGRVRSISADSFVPEEGGREAFFLAKIDITAPELREVPADFRLVPGMPLTADIAVGTRTLMAYLLEGALRTADEGMTEP